MNSSTRLKQASAVRLDAPSAVLPTTTAAATAGAAAGSAGGTEGVVSAAGGGEHHPRIPGCARILSGGGGVAHAFHTAHLISLAPS
jgi:hypothetical protein